MSKSVYISESINRSRSADVYNEDGSSQRITLSENIYIESHDRIDEDVEVGVLFKIAKSNEDKSLVSGWANISINADGSIPLDWQGDVIPPETLEKAAIDFMLSYRESGVMHEGDSTGVVVESIMLTKDKQASIGIPEGTVPEGWFITVKVKDPEVFAKVKDGTFKMFSIQGKAKRIKV